MEIPHGAPSYLLSVFGRVADREFAQERKEDPSITQVLHLINGGTVNRKISLQNGVLARWLATPQLSDQAVLDRLFLTTLCRHPRSQESAVVSRQLEGKTGAERRAVFEDAFWALLNSKEFLYVH
jgi:hypothetical protein